MRTDYAVRPAQALKVISARILVMVFFYQIYQIYLLFQFTFAHWRSPLPRKAKRPIDLTTDEAMKKLFPKKVVDKLKEFAHAKDHKSASSVK